MAIDRDQKYREMAVRGKYSELYAYLCALPAREWRTSFGEIESIIGFELPASARLYRPWWANQNPANGHSQALAWSVAGWETADVDMDAETLLLRRTVGETRPEAARGEFDLEKAWPVHISGAWPEDLSLRREDIYVDRM